MPKKKLARTIEECNAELERTQKLLQQYENRNKMLNGYIINKGRFFTFFLPPFSNHSARHRLPLLSYLLSGKSTRQLSNYKRKNYWLYKLSIYFSDARFHTLFGFPPASGRDSVPLVCPHCRP